MMQGIFQSVWAKHSLSRRLLVWLLPSLVLITVVEFSLSYRLAQQTIDEAYDRGLQSAVRALSLATRLDANGFSVEKPFQLLSYVQSNARGTVFFRVVTSDGLLEAGFTDLTFPWPSAPKNDEVLLAEGEYFDQHLRIAALRRELVAATAQSPAISVDLLVAEDLAPRQAYLEQFIWRTLLRDSILLVFTAVLLILIVKRSLSPLGRWSRLIRNRDSHDLTPLPINEALPLEARPLIESLNFHLDRGAQEQGQRRRFLDNASHQIRTPLAVLKTQIAWAKSQGSDLDAMAFLARFESQVDQASQHAAQMLQMARLESGQTLSPVAIAVLPLAQDVVVTLQALAQQRRIDLGLTCGADLDVSTRVWGDEGLIRQVFENLLDNAIRHGSAGGEATLSLTQAGETVLVAVENNGEQISDEVLAHLGERFYQADQASYWGSGLGLSIVAAILIQLGSRIKFEHPTSGGGLRAVFELNRVIEEEHNDVST